ncbi:hypothetical protein AB205_0162850, partial [Aquarana catesbeiana]
MASITNLGPSKYRAPSISERRPVDRAEPRTAHARCQFCLWDEHGGVQEVSAAGPVQDRFLADGESTKFQPPVKPVFIDKKALPESQRRFLSPEFIPRRCRKDPLYFRIERDDMIERRKTFNIPEFYVGSILAVTMSDPHAGGKLHRFVGLCIQRSGKGLGATFVLRNVIEGQGVEMRYDLYSPRMHEIQVLKLEKRLDSNLMYLRDALPEYSKFDVDMKPVMLLGSEVPVNP